MQNILDCENYIIAEVAAALRVSSSLVRYLILTRRIPVIRIGRRVFVKGRTILEIQKEGISYDRLGQS